MPSPAVTREEAAKPRLSQLELSAPISGIAGKLTLQALVRTCPQ